jgi:hypothetical protein
LAETYGSLARLKSADDRAGAMKDLEQAAKIYQQLAAQDRAEATYRVAWLETELASAILAGFPEGDGRYLTQVARINLALPGLWPDEPDALYRLACFLTQTEPILSKDLSAAATGSEKPDQKAADSSSTARSN